jgi:hypothetical protein
VLGHITIQAKEFFTVGIKDIDNSQNNDTQIGEKGSFDLSGRKIANRNLSPGLYIIDGRKVAVK